MAAGSAGAAFAASFRAAFARNPNLTENVITVDQVSGYMLCSASMLLVNKLAVHHLPAPSFVLLCQLLASALFTWSCGKAGLIEVDALTVAKASQFYIVPLAFLCTIYANIRILQYANVETFIVFRCSTPLLVCVADYFFLGRQLPSPRSIACLLTLLVGAVGYVLSDRFFEISAYLWVVVWFVVFCFDQVYIKHKCNTVKMTTWGRVFYTNAIATVPLAALLTTSGELQTLSVFEWNFVSCAWLLISCCTGTLIAYFAFLAREAISATYFTVVGNSCKIITVIINCLIWDKHASPAGLACLGLCLVGAYFYKQAPLRAANDSLPK